jgi:hypothetical protein
MHWVDPLHKVDYLRGFLLAADPGDVLRDLQGMNISREVLFPDGEDDAFGFDYELRQAPRGPELIRPDAEWVEWAGSQMRHR